MKTLTPVFSRKPLIPVSRTTKQRPPAREGAMVAAWRQKGLPLMLVLLFHIAHLLKDAGSQTSHLSEYRFHGHRLSRQFMQISDEIVPIGRRRYGQLTSAPGSAWWEHPQNRVATIRHNTQCQSAITHDPATRYEIVPHQHCTSSYNAKVALQYLPTSALVG